MHSELVAVVVPLYRSELNAYEKVSLEQGVKQLGNFPIIVVKPQSLSISHLKEQYPQITELSFEDHFFQSVHTYNLLLTQPEFYQAFLAYQYLLIYQLDAFVFHNSLEDWCKKGYDYIGAPNIAAKSGSLLDLKKPLLNGGLSLRKVEASIRLVQAYTKVFGQWPGNEDMLFSLHSSRLFPFRALMTLPDVDTALRFSVEQQPEQCWQALKQTLPFGCHAWEKYDIDFWRPHINQYGYRI